MTLMMISWLAAVVATAGVPLDGEWQWFKGNTHTHTWWSDGDSPPEVAVAWYKEHGYQFLVLSDHNILSEGEKWVNAAKGARAKAAENYEKMFSSDWIVKENRAVGDDQPPAVHYRLKTLSEFRHLFEDAGRFMLIVGEEITDSFEKRPVHLNGLNLREMIPPQHGDSVFETMQNNVNAVLAQQAKYGVPMLVHLNHPNFHYSNTAEDIMRLKGENFFEVFNGHPGVRNHGDERYPSTDRMWDIILTKRLAELDMPIMYGMATDDAHGYTTWGVGQANPGRGWVMVRARFLTPEHIIEALNRGDFYASTGVTLKKVTFADDTLSVEIDAQPGVNYRTQFIGTLAGYDPEHKSPPEDLTVYITRRYSDDIGQVLSEQTGAQASYKLTGREVYVRAKVISDAPHPNPFAEGDVQLAWVQPVRPTRAE